MKVRNDEDGTPPDFLEADPGGHGFSRRELLKRAGAVGIAIAIPAGIVGEGAERALTAEDRARPGPFTAAEAATVSAIVARIIPTDENGPGATEAGVQRYIDWLLRSPHNTHRSPNNPDSNLTDAYAAGLKAVDSYAQATHGGPFAKLRQDQQDAVLTAMEANSATGFTPDSRTFFNLIRQHAVEGMFCDPYYGGNANFVGWDLISYPGIKLIVPAEEQKLDVTVKSSRKGATDYAFFGRNRKGM
jgi:gluconate 2-dehydrogenase gamma chain